MATGSSFQDAPPLTRGEKPSGGRTTEGSTEKRRPLVLVVEDQREDWEIYGKVLWYNGFDVLHAASGAEGLDLARQHAPDMMLIDLVLPEMDGLELCRRVKSDPALTDIPVLMISARPKDEYRHAALDVGCVDFIEKPHSPVEIVHRVERLVGRPPPSGEGPAPALSSSVE